jgi:hypothetical protein
MYYFPIFKNEIIFVNVKSLLLIFKKQILILLFNEIKHLLSTISQQSNITLTGT